MRIDAIIAIARSELRAQLRGRMVLAFGGLFAALAIGIALAGLGASGQLLVQGFTRTAVSVQALALYLLPLLGLMLGAAAFGVEDGGTELLLSQPIERIDAFVGRIAGLALAVMVVSLAGFGSAALLVAMRTGFTGVTRYALLTIGVSTVALIALGIGALIGIRCVRRSTAVGWALASWLLAAVLYDLACIGALQLLGDGQPGPALIAFLALNPIDGVRTLGLVFMGADVLLGPTGAALVRLLGEGGALYILGALGAWLVLPLLAAARLHARRDY